MSVKSCKCVLPFGNTGRPSSVLIPSVTKMLIGQALQDGDGNFNAIDLLVDDLTDPAYFTAKINDPDPLKRWYPIDGIEAIENLRADPVTETVDNTAQISQEGARTFTASAYERGAVFAGKLKSWGCEAFGFYYVDICPNITGTYVSTATIEELRPTAVNTKTWSVIEFYDTSATNARVQIQYQYGQLERDENFRTIESSEIGVNLLDLRGLVDLNTVVSAISLSGHTVAITRDYWTGKGPSPFVGLLAVDLQVDEISPAAGNIAIVSSTETVLGESGIYDITYAAQTAADVLETTLADESGFDLEQTRHIAAV